MSSEKKTDDSPIEVTRGELVESRVTISHDDYNIMPGDTMKVIDFDANKVLVEPVHLTGSKMVLPRKAIRKSDVPEDFLDLPEYERASLGGLGDLTNMPEDIIEDLDTLEDTEKIEYE